MWIINVVSFLPGYLPSVFRGERLKKTAPVWLAMACANAVLPVSLQPYRSRVLQWPGMAECTVSPLAPRGKMASSVTI